MKMCPSVHCEKTSKYNCLVQLWIFRMPFVCMSVLSHVWLFVTPWTAAPQAPLSIGFSRQEYWSGLPCPSLGALPEPLLHWQSDSLPLSHLGSPSSTLYIDKKKNIHQKTPMTTSEEPRAKTGCWEQKQGTLYAPCIQHHQKGGQTT